ncbi:uncharacterized protein [Bemisia tabaci]|uniref:uncharacterized protein isoform X1 n=1 Tax=Bemisia tabaci TaxID=7038 RepID=UPI003B284815
MSNVDKIGIGSDSCMFSSGVTINAVPHRVAKVGEWELHFYLLFPLYIIMESRRNLRRSNSTMIRTSLKTIDHYMKYYFPSVIAIIVVCIFKTVISTRVDFDYTLRRHGIIPDVIDIAPKFAIKISIMRHDSFDDQIIFMFKISYKRNESLRMGFKVDPALMQHVPWIAWPTEAGVFYTLLMIDPDVPVRKNPAEAQRLHWLVGNIPRENPHHGETITSYIGPISPKNSDQLFYTKLN